MEPLNYCRQIQAQCGRIIEIPSVDELDRGNAAHLRDLIIASKKFILPENGILIDDADLRALGEEALSLRLPYDMVALEFLGPPWAVIASEREKVRRLGIRCVLFCSSGDVDSAEIVVRPVVFRPSSGTWGADKEFAIESISRKDGVNVTMKIRHKRGEDQSIVEGHTRVVLGFLNALACSNVHIERREPRKAGRRIKAALPFDTYHVLTIDVPSAATQGNGAGTPGSHRSPREHLRRGHIRRLTPPIWINATVVAAGRGAGKVKKDYAIRATIPSRHTPAPIALPPKACDPPAPPARPSAT